jgi:hypothetical protein
MRSGEEMDSPRAINRCACSEQPGRIAQLDKMKGLTTSEPVELIPAIVAKIILLDGVLHLGPSGFKIVLWKILFDNEPSRRSPRAPRSWQIWMISGSPSLRTRALRPCPLATKPSVVRMISASRTETGATPNCRAQRPSMFFSPGKILPARIALAIRLTSGELLSTLTIVNCAASCYALLTVGFSRPTRCRPTSGYEAIPRT